MSIKFSFWEKTLIWLRPKILKTYLRYCWIAKHLFKATYILRGGISLSLSLSLSVYVCKFRTTSCVIVPHHIDWILKREMERGMGKPIVHSCRCRSHPQPPLSPASEEYDIQTLLLRQDRRLQIKYFYFEKCNKVDQK